MLRKWQSSGAEHGLSPEAPGHFTSPEAGGAVETGTPVALDCLLKAAMASRSLMEAPADTHGIQARRKEDIADCLVRVLYRPEYFDHGLLAYAGVVTLLEKHE